MLYAFQTHKNEEVATFHFRKRLPGMGWLSSDNKDPAGVALKARLEAIEGVTEATSYRGYALSIHRGGAFAWDEIKPYVLLVIADHFGIDADDFRDVETYPETEAQEA